MVPVIDDPHENPDMVVHVGASVVPAEVSTCPAVQFASMAVVPAADWYGMLPPDHPARLVAVVAVPPQIAT